MGLTVAKQINVYFSKFINLGTMNKHRYVNYMSSNDIIFYLTLQICKKIMNCKSFFSFTHAIKFLSSHFKCINQFNSFNISANK